jgi:putative transposase
VILARSIVRAQLKHNFAVLAYVFMPDHIHLVLFPLDDIYDMSEISKSIKLSATKTAQRRGIVKHMVWESGGGYDRNIYSRKERIEKIWYTLLNPVRRGLVEDPTLYRWSSAKWYLTGEQSDIQCHFRDELNQE